MYKNIGKKIKGLAYFLVWALIAICSFYAFYRFFQSEMNAKNIMISSCIIIGGCIVSCFFSWFIYALGELIESEQKQIEYLETLLILVEDIKKDKNKPSKEENSFDLPNSREELFNSQMKKLKKDYEMSRITYDEYEEGKRKLEQKYR